MSVQHFLKGVILDLSLLFQPLLNHYLREIAVNPWVLNDFEWDWMLHFRLDYWTYSCNNLYRSLITSNGSRSIWGLVLRIVFVHLAPIRLHISIIGLIASKRHFQRIHCSLVVQQSLVHNTLLTQLNARTESMLLDYSLLQASKVDIEVAVLP